MIGLGAVDGILREGALPPCVDASHTVDIQVDIQIDKASPLDILGIAGFSQSFWACAVIANTEAKKTRTFFIIYSLW